MSNAVIASIYFDDIKFDRERCGCRIRIPAVPNGGTPEMVAIANHQEWVQRLMAEGGGKETRTITAQELASDFINEVCLLGLWTSPECGPGVWIVRDQVMTGTEKRPNPDGTGMIDVPAYREATKKEHEAMFAEDWEKAKLRQAAYADVLIMKADRFDADPNPENRRWISALMRKACKYAGRQRPWLPELSHQDVKHCQFCTKPVPAAAVKCHHCNEIINFEKYAELEAMREAAKRAAIAGKQELAGAIAQKR